MVSLAEGASKSGGSLLPPPFSAGNGCRTSAESTRYRPYPKAFATAHSESGAAPAGRPRGPRTAPGETVPRLPPDQRRHAVCRGTVPARRIQRRRQSPCWTAFLGKEKVCRKYPCETSEPIGVQRRRCDGCGREPGVRGSSGETRGPGRGALMPLSVHNEGGYMGYPHRGPRCRPDISWSSSACLRSPGRGAG